MIARTPVNVRLTSIPVLYLSLFNNKLVKAQIF
nr:MAG TPA: hypothetical protein [Caudoviricetes sp.]